jgi:hypothetical protein
MIQSISIGLALGLLCACDGEGEADQGDNVPGEGVHTCVVDPDQGTDSPPASGQLCGTTKTVTYQLTQLKQAKATNVDVIVDGGTYTASTEQFPIVVPDGIHLRGDDSSGAAPVIFSGAGPYTSSGGGLFQAALVLVGAAQAYNLQIASDSIGLLLDNTADGASVQDVSIGTCQRGMVALQSSVALVTQLITRGCAITGIETHDTSAVTFTQSTVTQNGVGVLVEDDSQPQFGGAQAGANTFSGNVLCNFESRSMATLNVVGNTWDGDVFSFIPQSQCTGGANLVVEGPGSVIYQYLPQQNAPLFPATSLVTLSQPVYGSTVNTTEPPFAWNPSTSSTLVAMAVWDEQPEVGVGGIQNADHIVLFWNSGLKTGSVGSVSFSDLRTPVAGDVTNLAAPQDLVQGRPYYWAVWEWDPAGVNVVASSEVGVFTVRP